MAGGKRNIKKKNVLSTGSESDTNDLDNTFPDLSEEGQQLLLAMERKVALLVKDLQKQLYEKDKKISNLEQTVSTLKKTVTTLNEKIEDTEAYERRDTVVISGGELPIAADNENSSEIACNLIKDKVGVVIRPSEISVAHRLGKKPTTQAQDRRGIIVKLCRREIKQDLMQACKRVKPKNLYINESLTPTRSTALYGLRQARRKFPEKISGTGSHEGKVFVWIKPPNPNTPMPRNTKVFVNNRDKFEDICKNILNCDPNELVINWPKF